MTKTTKGLATVVLMATLALAAVPARAQDQDQIQLGTQEVVLDLIVTDGKGKPVTDLRQDEVKVLEGGEPQEITSFGLVQTGSAGDSTATGSKPPVSLEISPFRGFNYIIVLVDRTSLNSQDLKSTYAAAERFVNERLGPDDLVSVFVAASRLVMVQNFTNNKQRLLEAMRVATDASGDVVNINVRERLAARVDPFNPQAAGNGAQQAQPADSAAGAGAAIEQLNAFASGVTTTFDDISSQFQGVALVRDLLTLMKVYSGIPGRKSVLFYSEGFVVDDSLAGAFDAVVGTANRNNFAIYTVDAAGLRSTTVASGSGPGLSTPTSLSGDRSLVDSSGNSGLGRASRDVRSGGSGALHRLAAETGGVPLRNNNDLNRGFQAVEQDLRSYYALSYAPKNSALDGKYRPVKVEITRKGVEVRARKGYYATPGGSVLLPFEQPVLEMLAAATPESRPSDLPVSMRAERFRSGDGWSIPIVAMLPASALSPAVTKEKSTTTGFEVDMVAVVRDAKGTIVAKASRSIPWVGPTDKIDEFRKLDLANSFSEPFVLPAGTYKLSLAVYDPNAQKGTVIERSMLLPKVAPDTPTLSSIVLSRDVVPLAETDRAKAASDPLVFEGNSRILPNATGKFLKSRGDRLVTYFRFYGAPSKQYQVRMEFVLNGKVVNASQPTALPATSPSGETAFAPTIPIDGLEPGTYLLKLVVIDPATSKPVADGTANFRVEQ